MRTKCGRTFSCFIVVLWVEENVEARVMVQYVRERVEVGLCDGGVCGGAGCVGFVKTGAPVTCAQVNCWAHGFIDLLAVVMLENHLIFI